MQFDDIADPQTQVSLQHKGGGGSLVGAEEARAFPHCGDNFLVLLSSQSLGFLVHGFSFGMKVRIWNAESSYFFAVFQIALWHLVFTVRNSTILGTLPLGSSFQSQEGVQRLCADGEAAAGNLLRVSLVDLGHHFLKCGAVEPLGENGGVADDVLSRKHAIYSKIQAHMKQKSKVCETGK